MNTLKIKFIQLILIAFFTLAAITSIFAKNICIHKNTCPNEGVRIVNYSNKTITIKATYFVRGAQIVKTQQTDSKEQKHYSYTGYTKKEVQKLKEKINQKLNKQHYRISQGSYKGFYLIFDLDFIWVASAYEARLRARETFYKGNCIGNTFEIGNPKHPLFTEKKLENDNGTTTIYSAGGVTYNKKHIVMNPTKNLILNQIHEIFHTLGMCHKDNQGIMSYPPHMPNQEDINCFTADKDQNSILTMKWILLENESLNSIHQTNH